MRRSDPPDLETVKQRPREEQLEVLLDALDHFARVGYHDATWAWREFALGLGRRGLPWDEDALARALDALVEAGRGSDWGLQAEYGPPVNAVVGAVRKTFSDEAIPSELQRRLREVHRLLGIDAYAADTQAQRKIESMLTDDDPDALPVFHDPWGSALLAAADHEAAAPLLRLAEAGSKSKPPADFAEQRDALLAEHGAETVGELAGTMLQAAATAVPVTKAESQIPPDTGDVLRGLCWVAGACDTDAAARGLGAIAEAGWKKVPGAGPLSRKAASAGIRALAGQTQHGPAHLGRIRPLIKQPSAIEEVDAAIDEVAERLGIARGEFEERVVPRFGLDAEGVRREELGEHTAELALGDDLKAKLTFVKGDGKRLKSVPAAVKEEHAEALAALRQEAKDITAMAGAQRLRLERLLLDEREWPLEAWRSRYAEHGLVGTLARRLIWTFDGTPALWGDDATDGLADDAVVRLWHPVLAGADEVRAWREELERREVVQPFKQAHREVYLLTDAERETRTYSNRFAAHVIRQHQFAALARGRGWRYALQGAYDSPDEQAELDLPQHGLVASFWVDRPWDAQDDWNDAGIFTHVLTDQVRFRDEAGEDVALDDVPERVFSEVMRDVDLFVGVASIGNDPTWQDGGGPREWDHYWGQYAFGDLSAQAEVRKDLLERLLPRLKIADVTRIDGRYLKVRGKQREYAIHLGSGNIRMSPNDEYLCIVPGRGDESPHVFLPFEGDRVLSIILSKALMLAADDDIEDPTIRSQIDS